MSTISRFVLALSMVFGNAAWANPPRAYITMEPGFFSSPRLNVDGKEVRHGFFTGWELASAVQSNPEALRYAERYESYTRWSSISVFGGLGGAITYALVAGGDRFDSGVYWSIFLVPFLVGVGLGQAGSSYFLKAINAYNGVGAPTTAQLRFNLGPTSDGQGGVAGLTYSF